MNVTKIIDAFGYVIYGALALLAVWGVYNGILLYRTLSKKSLARPGPLIHQVRELCQARKFDAADHRLPEPGLLAHGARAAHRRGPPRTATRGWPRSSSSLVMEFHTEVIAGMENRLASISTIVRMGPLLGLLGTVASMIGAFGRIGGAEKVNPHALASDISLALWATGAGLLIATPMMIIGNDIHARLRRLRDRTERQLQDFLEILEHIEGQGHAPIARAARAEAGSPRAAAPR